MLEIASLAVISLLGAMSPGPDFAIVTRHALTGSRRSAILASLGISLALLVHVSYCAFGVAFLIAESPLLFRLIQIAGSSYLAYLGLRLLFSSIRKPSPTSPPPAKAFLSGLLTNLLNPKATLFILSLFTQFVRPGLAVFTQLLYGLVIAGTALAWFSALSFLITHPLLHARFAHFQIILMKGMGVVLLILAGFVLFNV